MRPKDEEIAHLLAEFDRSGWSEMELTLGSFRLVVSRNAHGPAGSVVARTVPVTPPPATPSPFPSPAAAAPPAPAAPKEQRATKEDRPGLHAIRAPNLGRFWRRPKPGEPPFVDVGSEVKPGDVICIIEVMKLFTQVKSEVAGRVVECPVEDGGMVEFDDVLFWLEPKKG